MRAYQGRRTFGPSRFAIGATTVALLIFVTGAVWTQRTAGWTFTSIGLTAMSVLAVAGVIEAAIQRIVLTEDEMLVFDLLRRRRYPRSAIASVHHAKGSPLVIVLDDGTRAELPTVANDIANSVRAWIRAT